MARLNSVKTMAMLQFIEQNPNLVIEDHPSDIRFLILRNCDFAQGAKLCAKYGASGSSCGQKSEHFSIGNFGQYN